MRSKGDYRSGKQMRKDPYLKRTMQNAVQFGVASRIVKYTYYHHLPPEVRKFGLFAQLTGRVKRWLQAGKSSEEAETLLIAYLQTLVPAAQTEAPTPAVSQPAPVLPPQSAPKNTKQVPSNQKQKQARYRSRAMAACTYLNTTPLEGSLK